MLVEARFVAQRRNEKGLVSRVSEYDNRAALLFGAVRGRPPTSGT